MGGKEQAGGKERVDGKEQAGGKERVGSKEQVGGKLAMIFYFQQKWEGVVNKLTPPGLICYNYTYYNNKKIKSSMARRIY